MLRLGSGQLRALEPTLQEGLRVLRAWQAGRLASHYADQLAMPARHDAVRFFLDDVYGASDFTQRDEQFARAMRHLQRLLPTVALEALRDAVELHALTVELDTDLAARLSIGAVALGGAEYSAAYLASNREMDRRRQIELAVAIGRRLQQLTAHPTMEWAMRLASGPAWLGGFGILHSFIERGYLAFQRLGPEAGSFIDTIETRETAYMQRLLHAAEAAP